MRRVEKLPYVSFWFIFMIGLISYWWFSFVEYGAIVTVIITFLCSLFSGIIAYVIKTHRLVILSVLLILSPWVTFLLIKY